MLVQHHPVPILSYPSEMRILNADFLIIDIAVEDPGFSRWGRQPQRLILTYYCMKMK